MTKPESIYNSPDVYKPEVTGGLEQPLFTDIRGEIHRLTAGGKKLNLLFTRKGFMRSGDLHRNTQMDFVYSGKLELWLMHDGMEEKSVYGPNSFISIAPHTPHLFNFLEDTVMSEWWDGPFEAWYYRPYREIIDRQFKKMTTESV